MRRHGLTGRWHGFFVLAQFCLAATILLNLTGCSGCSPKAPELPQPSPEATQADTDAKLARPDQVTMKEIDLYLHDSGATDGLERKPTFWVHAKTFALNESMYTFEDASAVIYARGKKNGFNLPDTAGAPQQPAPATEGENAGEGEGEEEIHVEAKKGEFQEGQRAYLSGGVTAKLRDMTIELSDMEWVNDKREARTGNPVKVQGQTINVSASSLKMYPDQKVLEMTNVSGLVQLGSKKP
jgi:hypothetical protein